MFPVEMFTFEAVEGCGKGGGEEIPSLPAPASVGCHILVCHVIFCVVAYVIV